MKLHIALGTIERSGFHLLLAIELIKGPELDLVGPINGLLDDFGEVSVQFGDWLSILFSCYLLNLLINFDISLLSLFLFDLAALFDQFFYFFLGHSLQFYLKGFRKLGR